MKILSYKPISKGFLQGICSLELPSGLQVREICIFSKNESRWIAFPSRKYEAEGREKFFPYLYLDSEKMKKFQTQLLDALDNWIKENPIIAPEQAKEQLEEELPF